MPKTFVPGEILTASDVNEFLVSKIIDVKHALKTNTQVAPNVGARGGFNVEGLSITHELRNPDNLLIISAFFGLAANGNGRGEVGLAITVDDALIGEGDEAGSRLQTIAGGEITSTSYNRVVTMPSVTFVYAPGPGEKTYRVRALNLRGGTTPEAIYINRTELDTDSDFFPRGSSALVIQEVAV